MPGGLTFGLDGNLYVAGFGTNNILRYDSKTGAFINDFVPTGSGGLNGSVKPIFGSDGNLYVSSLNSNQVLRYNGKTGAFIDTFIPAGTGGLNGAGFLAFTKEKTLVPEPELQFALLGFASVLFIGKVFREKGKF